MIVVAWVSIQEPSFLSRQNIFNISSEWSAAGIMAVGVTFVILVGGLDLSFAATFSLCAILAAYVGRSHAPILAFAASVGLGLGIGLFNGILVTVAQINSFIATLGMSFALTSVAQILTSNVPYVVEREDFLAFGTGTWHTIPYTGITLVCFFLVGGLILSRTVYGQLIYAVGGNPEASRLGGVRVRTVVASAFVISGLCAGVAGCISASQLGSAQGNIDPDVLFNVITMVILGGTSLAGGFGGMWRTAVGLAIIASIANAFNLLNVDPHYQDIAKGAILIGALALDSMARRLAKES
ncbi:MAG TPA: ABC transporter permease [Gaiellaceae bacterium]|nr:ABC transporter permease [Gaiellaceae bacterium]